MNHYLAAMRRYAVFRGRTSRAEFWWFCGIYMLGAVIAIIADVAVFGIDQEGSGILSGIYALVHVLPGVAVQVRRLHDIDRTGWWMLFNLTGIGLFVTLALNMIPGTEGANRYGSDPKADDDVSRHAAAPHAPARADVRADLDLGTLAPAPRPEPRSESLAGARDARHAQSHASPGDLIGDLERFAQLKANGGLTEAEYEAMKSRMLARASEA